MKAKKTLFSRATALVTAVALFLTGIMGYTFAVEGNGERDAVEIKKENGFTFEFSLEINGTKLEKGSNNTNDDGKPKIRADEVDNIYLDFSWSHPGFFSEEQQQKLKDTDGLLKYDIGEIVGFYIPDDVAGILGFNAENPKQSFDKDGNPNAEYWIEGGYLYVRLLGEEAYESDKHDGDCRFTGKLDKEAVEENDNKMVVGDITYEFDFSNNVNLNVSKSAEGFVSQEDGRYYQEFKVTVTSQNGPAKGVYLEDVLGDLFDGIYDVKINGETFTGKINDKTYSEYEDGFVEKTGSNIKIELGDTNYSDEPGTWLSDAITITYKARLRSDVDKSMVEHGTFGSYSGVNTATAKSTDDAIPGSSSAWVQTDTKVTKTGTLNEDKDSITWRISIKSEKLPEGADLNFTITDIFGDDNRFYEEYDQYLDLSKYNEYFNRDGSLTAAGKDAIKYDDEKREYYLEFETPIDNPPDTAVSIINKAKVKYDNDNTPFESQAGVWYDPSTSVPTVEGKITKKLFDYTLYDPDDPDSANIFTWKVEYTVPTNTGEVFIYDKLYDDHDYAHKNYQDNVVILKDTFKILDDDGNELDFYFVDSDPNSRVEYRNCEFGLFIKDADKYIGETLHITYKTQVNVNDPVSYIKNYVQDATGKSDFDDQTFKIFKTHKKAYSDTLVDGQNYEVTWFVYVKAEGVGYDGGEVITITDVIPDGLVLVEDSAFAGYMGNSGSGGSVNPLVDGEYGDSTHAPAISGPSKVDGGMEYTFTFTFPTKDEVPSWGWLFNDPAICPAVTFKTRLADGYYDQIINGEIPNPSFTNHASSTVTVGDDTNKGTNAEDTFYPKINKDDNLIKKEYDAEQSTIVNDKAPIIHYVITVNKAKQRLTADGNGKITLVDTMGSKLYLLRNGVDNVHVYDVNNGNTEVFNCWTYDEAFNTLTFTLNDKTTYRIEYDVTASLPKDKTKTDTWKAEDYYNSATLIIGDNSVTSTEKTDWVISSDASYTNSNITRADLEITKVWEDTTDYVHKLVFTLEWEKYHYDGTTRVKDDDGTQTYPITTDDKNTKFTIDVPAYISEGGTTYYYDYTLKEIKVDGDSPNSNSYEVSGSITGVYDADGNPIQGVSGVEYGTSGIQISGKDLFEGNKGTASIAVEIKNTYSTTPIEEKISVKVTKSWSDGENTIAAPSGAKVKVQLTANGQPKGDIVTLEGDNWSHTWDDLPKLGDDGNPIDYKVVEVDAKDNVIEVGENSYTVSSKKTTAEDGSVTVELTNTLNKPKTISVTVNKEWTADGTTKAREGSEVKVKLTINGEPQGATITLNSSNQWKHTWEELAKDNTYGVVEVDDNGTPYGDGKTGGKVIQIGDDKFEVSYSGTVTGDDGSITVTNKLVNKTSVKVTKSWDMSGTNLSSDDFTVDVKLIGGNNTKPVETLNSTNQWTHTWDDLPKYDNAGNLIAYSVEEVIGGTAYGEGKTGGKVIQIGTDRFEVSYSGNAKDGFTVTNKLVNTTSVKVTKSWDMSNTNLSPDGFTVDVKLIGGNNTKPVETLNSTNQWTHTWDDLPKYDNAGNLIAYSVEEVIGGTAYGEGKTGGKVIQIGTDRFEVSYSGNAETGFIVTNKLVNTTEVTVTKEWVAGALGVRKDGSQAQVKLTVNGIAESEVVTLNSANNWSHTWTNLAKYDAAGNPITYGVVEVGDNDSHIVQIGTENFEVSYSGNAETGFTVTNKLVNKTEVTVIKEWAAGALGVRKDGSQAQVKLTVNGVAENDVITLNSGNNWSHKWTNLAKYDAAGNPITYGVVEVGDNDDSHIVQIGDDSFQVSYSAATYDGDGNSTIKVTNTLVNKTSVTVTKKWDKDWLYDKGLQVTVKLTGSDSTEYTVPLDSNNNWTKTWDDLPKYDANGNKITYSVVEVGDNDNSHIVQIGTDSFVVSYSGNAKDGFTVTNTLVNKTSVTVTKKWDQSWLNNTNLKVTLKLTGVSNTEYSVTLPDPVTGWTHTWNDLPKYDANGNKITYSVVEVIGDTAYGENETGGKVIKIGNDSFEVTYGGTSESGLTVTNTLDNTTSVKVVKIWEGGSAPVGVGSVTVNLYADSTLKDTQTLSSGNNWSYEWNDPKLPKYDDNGKLIVYSVKEVGKDGNPVENGKKITLSDDNEYSVVYGVNTDGELTVTNTLNLPDTTSVTVTKDWNMGNSGLSKDALTVKVRITGTDMYPEPRTLSAPDWSTTWVNLPEGGTYGVEEVKEVDGVITPCGEGEIIQIGDDKFEVSYGGDAANGFTVTNKLIDETEVTVTKKWADGKFGAHKEGSQVTVMLTRYVGGVEEGVEIATLSASDNWTKTWEHLAKYDGHGIPYVYDVKEVEEVAAADVGDELITLNGVQYKVYKAGDEITIGDYIFKVSYVDSDANGGITVVNTLNDETSVKVTKVWQMGNSGLSEDDLEVEVQLTGGDPRPSVTLKSENNWTGEWTNLPKYDNDGNQIDYGVKEVTNDNGELIIDNEDGTHIFTVRYRYVDESGSLTDTVTDVMAVVNTLNEKTSVDVQKLWADNNGSAPDGVASVQVKLVGGNNNEQPITLDSAHGWKGGWTNLTKYDGGKLIEYSVEEIGVYDANGLEIDEYTFDVGYGQLNDGTLTVTNTLNMPETISVTVNKSWGEGQAPEGATVKIKLVGIDREIGELNSENDWTYTWDDLPKDGDYSVEEIEVVIDGTSYPVDGTTLQIGDNTYTVSYGNPIAEDDDITIDVDNTLNNPETISVTVNKSWGEGQAPEGATVRIKLVGIDREIGELNSENGWTYTWDDLPKDGDYSVEEVEVVIDGTSYPVDGTTLQIGDNTYTVSYGNPIAEDDDITIDVDNTLNNPETISVTVNKSWGEGQAPEGATVKIKLVGIDREIGELNSENGWTYTWDDLPKDGDYSVEEVEVVIDGTSYPVDGTTLQIGDNTYTVSYVAPIAEDDDITINVTNTLNDETPEEPEEPEEPEPDLDIEKTQSVNGGEETKVKTQVKAEDIVTYYITVTNNGNATAKGVVIRDVIPAGLEQYGPISNGTLTKTDDGMVIEWTCDIEPGESVVMSFMVKVPRVTEYTVWPNRASVTHDGEDPEYSNTVEVEEKPETPSTPNNTPNYTPDPKPEETTTVEETTTEETTVEETTAEETTVEETTVVETIAVPSIPEYHPPVTSDDNFNMFDDGNPRGDMNIPTEEDDNFNMFDDGNPRGNMNLPTGVAVGGSVVGLAAGSLIIAAVAQAIGKRKGGKKK